MLTLTQIILRILIILILSGLIGLERVYHQKTVGSYFRTNILVGLGSTLAMLIALYLSHNGYPEIDPTRIAGQVITGIGFLGAGAIIQSRFAVHGLTTAATIWTVAIIGLAVGVGFYLAAIITTITALFVLMIFRKVDIESEKKFHNKL